MLTSMHLNDIYQMIGISLLIGCFACGGGREDVTLRLTPNERTRIDTLYTQRVKEMKPIWDSLCEAHHDSMLRYAVDSIIQERLADEAELRARILRESADTLGPASIPPN